MSAITFAGLWKFLSRRVVEARWANDYAGTEVHSLWDGYLGAHQLLVVPPDSKRIWHVISKGGPLPNTDILIDYLAEVTGRSNSEVRGELEELSKSKDEKEPA